MIVNQNHTYVAKLRVRSSTCEALSLRLRLNQAMASLNLHPAGFPPSATVFVRRLRDPAPGLLDLNNASVPAAWEQAVAASLDRIVRRAARPAREHVGADTEAVLFHDRAELLACLAVDWCEGTAITRWWWQSLFRATDVSSAVVREWLTSIEYVPAAFARLAEKRMAVEFAAALPALTVSRLVEDIIMCFGLSDPRAAPSESKKESSASAKAAVADSDGAAAEQWQALSPRELSNVRIRLAPEAFTSRLDQVGRLLVAVALMLERAPALLRERGFVPRLSATLRGFEMVSLAGKRDSNDPRGVVIPVDSANSRPSNKNQTAAQELQTATDGQAEAGWSQHGNDLADHLVSEPFHPGTHRQSADGDRPARDLPLSAELRSEPNSSSLDTSTENALLFETQVLESADVAETGLAVSTTDLAIETEFGGLLYLINAALALDLYGDFTTPLDPGIELPLWDFLALAGLELIGVGIKSDPIWQLLAALSGRRGSEEPGARFEPSGDWRLSASGLSAFPERAEWSYQVTRQRLVVWHPAGFEVIDVKLGEQFRMRDLLRKVRSETGSYSNIAGFKRRRAPADKRSAEPRSLDRWVGWIANYLRARLARSLGADACGVTTILFERRARVEVSVARLNVFFSLADLPVDIRLAGLDRNPGWVPAAGREIAFNYD